MPQAGKPSPLSRPWVRVAALAAISACSLALFVMTFMVLLPKVSMSYERVAGSMTMVRRRGAAFLELTTPVQGPRVSVEGKALIVPRQDQTGPGAVLGQRVGVVYARSINIPSRNIALTWEDLVADETRWEKKHCNFPNGAFNPAAIHEGDVPPCVCAANTSWVGPSCGVCAEWASQPDQADPCNGRGSLTNPYNTDGDPDFDFCGVHAANTTCECTINHWAGRWCTECPQPYRGAQCDECGWCVPDLCQHGSTCVEANSTTSTVSVGGATAQSTRCAEQGQCVNAPGEHWVGTYRQLCEPWWDASTCRDCLVCSVGPGSACTRHGTCAPNLDTADDLTGCSNYTCTCDVNFSLASECQSCVNSWTGTDCATCPLCGPRNPCLNGGNCTHNDCDFVSCACAEGFYGDRCEFSCVDCNPANCVHGTCTTQGFVGCDDGTYHKCDCDPFFRGEDCDQCQGYLRGPDCDVCNACAYTTCARGTCNSAALTQAQCAQSSLSSGVCDCASANNELFELLSLPALQNPDGSYAGQSTAPLTSFTAPPLPAAGEKAQRAFGPLPVYGCTEDPTDTQWMLLTFTASVPISNLDVMLTSQPSDPSPPGHSLVLMMGTTDGAGPRYVQFTSGWDGQYAAAEVDCGSGNCFDLNTPLQVAVAVNRQSAQSFVMVVDPNTLEVLTALQMDAGTALGPVQAGSAYSDGQITASTWSEALETVLSLNSDGNVWWVPVTGDNSTALTWTDIRTASVPARSLQLPFWVAEFPVVGSTLAQSPALEDLSLVSTAYADRNAFEPPLAGAPAYNEFVLPSTQPSQCTAAMLGTDWLLLTSRVQTAFSDIDFALTSSPLALETGDTLWFTLGAESNTLARFGAAYNADFVGTALGCGPACFPVNTELQLAVALNRETAHTFALLVDPATLEVLLSYTLLPTDTAQDGSTWLQAVQRVAGAETGPLALYWAPVSWTTPVQWNSTWHAAIPTDSPDLPEWVCQFPQEGDTLTQDPSLQGRGTIFPVAQPPFTAPVRDGYEGFCGSAELAAVWDIAAGTARVEDGEFDFILTGDLFDPFATNRSLWFPIAGFGNQLIRFGTGVNGPKLTQQYNCTTFTQPGTSPELCMPYNSTVHVAVAVNRVTADTVAMIVNETSLQVIAVLGVEGSVTAIDGRTWKEIHTKMLSNTTNLFWLPLSRTATEPNQVQYTDFWYGAIQEGSPLLPSWVTSFPAPGDVLGFNPATPPSDQSPSTAADCCAEPGALPAVLSDAGFFLRLGTTPLTSFFAPVTFVRPVTVAFGPVSLRECTTVSSSDAASLRKIEMQVNPFMDCSDGRSLTNMWNVLVATVTVGSGSDLTVLLASSLEDPDATSLSFTLAGSSNTQASLNSGPGGAAVLGQGQVDCTSLQRSPAGQCVPTGTAVTLAIAVSRQTAQTLAMVVDKSSKRVLMSLQAQGASALTGGGTWGGALDSVLGAATNGRLFWVPASTSATATVQYSTLWYTTIAQDSLALPDWIATFPALGQTLAADPAATSQRPDPETQHWSGPTCDSCQKPWALTQDSSGADVCSQCSVCASLDCQNGAPCVSTSSSFVPSSSQPCPAAATCDCESLQVPYSFQVLKQNNPATVTPPPTSLSSENLPWFFLPVPPAPPAGTTDWDSSSEPLVDVLHAQVTVPSQQQLIVWYALASVLDNTRGVSPQSPGQVVRLAIGAESNTQIFVVFGQGSQPWKQSNLVLAQAACPAGGCIPSPSRLYGLYVSAQRASGSRISCNMQVTLVDTTDSTVVLSERLSLPFSSSDASPQGDVGALSSSALTDRVWGIESVVEPSHVVSFAEWSLMGQQDPFVPLTASSAFTPPVPGATLAVPIALPRTSMYGGTRCDGCVSGWGGTACQECATLAGHSCNNGGNSYVVSQTASPLCGPSNMGCTCQPFYSGADCATYQFADPNYGYLVLRWNQGPLTGRGFTQVQLVKPVLPVAFLKATVPSPPASAAIYDIFVAHVTQTQGEGIGVLYSTQGWNPTLSNGADPSQGRTVIAMLGGYDNQVSYLNVQWQGYTTSPGYCQANNGWAEGVCLPPSGSTQLSLGLAINRATGNTRMVVLTTSDLSVLFHQGWEDDAYGTMVWEPPAPIPPSRFTPVAGETVASYIQGMNSVSGQRFFGLVTGTKGSFSDVQWTTMYSSDARFPLWVGASLQKSQKLVSDLTPLDSPSNVQAPETCVQCGQPFFDLPTGVMSSFSAASGSCEIVSTCVNGAVPDGASAGACKPNPFAATLLSNAEAGLPATAPAVNPQVTYSWAGPVPSYQDEVWQWPLEKGLESLMDADGMSTPFLLVGGQFTQACNTESSENTRPGALCLYALQGSQYRVQVQDTSGAVQSQLGKEWGNGVGNGLFNVAPGASGTQVTHDTSTGDAFLLADMTAGGTQVDSTNPFATSDVASFFDNGDAQPLLSWFPHANDDTASVWDAATFPYSARAGMVFFFANGRLTTLTGYWLGLCVAGQNLPNAPSTWRLALLPCPTTTNDPAFDTFSVTQEGILTLGPLTDINGKTSLIVFNIALNGGEGQGIGIPVSQVNGPSGQAQQKPYNYDPSGLLRVRPLQTQFPAGALQCDTNNVQILAAEEEGVFVEPLSQQPCMTGNNAANGDDQGDGSIQFLLVPKNTPVSSGTVHAARQTGVRVPGCTECGTRGAAYQGTQVCTRGSAQVCQTCGGPWMGTTLSSRTPTRSVQGQQCVNSTCISIGTTDPTSPGLCVLPQNLQFVSSLSAMPPVLASVPLNASNTFAGFGLESGVETPFVLASVKVDGTAVQELDIVYLSCFEGGKEVRLPTGLPQQGWGNGGLGNGAFRFRQNQWTMDGTLALLPMSRLNDSTSVEFGFAVQYQATSGLGADALHAWDAQSVDISVNDGGGDPTIVCNAIGQCTTGVGMRLGLCLDVEPAVCTMRWVACPQQAVAQWLILTFRTSVPVSNLDVMLTSLPSDPSPPGHSLVLMFGTESGGSGPAFVQFTNGWSGQFAGTYNCVGTCYDLDTDLMVAVAVNRLTGSTFGMVVDPSSLEVLAALSIDPSTTLGAPLAGPTYTTGGTLSPTWADAVRTVLSQDPDGNVWWAPIGISSGDPMRWTRIRAASVSGRDPDLPSWVQTFPSVGATLSESPALETLPVDSTAYADRNATVAPVAGDPVENEFLIQQTPVVLSTNSWSFLREGPIYNTACQNYTRACFRFVDATTTFEVEECQPWEAQASGATFTYLSRVPVSARSDWATANGTCNTYTLQPFGTPPGISNKAPLSEDPCFVPGRPGAPPNLYDGYLVTVDGVGVPVAPEGQAFQELVVCSGCSALTGGNGISWQACATPCGSLFDGVEDPSSTACGTFYYEGSWGTATSLYDTDGDTCSQSQCVNLAERASSSDSTCQVGDVVLPSSQTVAPAFTPSVDLRVVLSAENTQMGNGKGVDPQGWSAPFVFQASSTFFDGVTLQTYLVQMRPALMGWPPFPQALPAVPSSASLAGASWFDLPKGQATTSSSSSSFTFASFTTTVFWRQLMQSGALDANTIVATPYENATFQTRSWPLLQQDLGSAPAGVDGDFAMRRGPKGHVTTYAMWRLNLCFQARSDSSDRCTLYAAQCPTGADPTFDGFRFTSDGIMYTDGCEDQTERQCFYAVLDPDSGDAGLVLGQPCATFDQTSALYGVPATVAFTAGSASTASSVDCRTMQLARVGTPNKLPNINEPGVPPLSEEACWTGGLAQGGSASQTIFLPSSSQVTQTGLQQVTRTVTTCSSCFMERGTAPCTTCEACTSQFVESVTSEPVPLKVPSGTTCAQPSCIGSASPQGGVGECEPLPAVLPALQSVLPEGAQIPYPGAGTGEVVQQKAPMPTFGIANLALNASSIASGNDPSDVGQAGMNTYFVLVTDSGSARGTLISRPVLTVCDGCAYTTIPELPSASNTWGASAGNGHFGFRMSDVTNTAGSTYTLPMAFSGSVGMLETDPGPFTSTAAESTSGFSNPVTIPGTAPGHFSPFALPQGRGLDAVYVQDTLGYTSTVSMYRLGVCFQLDASACAVGLAACPTDNSDSSFTALRFTQEGVLYTTCGGATYCLQMTTDGQGATLQTCEPSQYTTEDLVPQWNPLVRRVPVQLSFEGTTASTRCKTATITGWTNNVATRRRSLLQEPCLTPGVSTSSQSGIANVVVTGESSATETYVFTQGTYTATAGLCTECGAAPLQAGETCTTQCDGGWEGPRCEECSYLRQLNCNGRGNAALTQQERGCHASNVFCDCLFPWTGEHCDQCVSTRFSLPECNECPQCTSVQAASTGCVMGECVGNFGCPSTPDQCNCTLSCSCYDGYQGAQCHQCQGDSALVITGTDSFGCLACPQNSVRNPASVWTADNTGVELPPPCVCAPGYQTGEEPSTYTLDTSQSAAANYKAAQSSVASQVFGKCVDPLLLESFTTWLFSETLKYSALRPPEQVVPNPCFVGQTTPASTSDCNGLTRDQYTVPWVLPSGSPLQPKYWDSGDTQSNGELNGVSSHGLPTDLYAFNDASMQPRLLVIVNARGANWYLFPSNYWRLPAQGFRSLFMWENADITLDNANKLPYSRLSGTYPPPGCTPDADGNCFGLYSQYTPDWSDPLPTDIELVQTFMISPLGLLTASSIHPLGLCLCLSEQCLIVTRVCPSSPDPACSGWRLSHQFMYIMHVQSTSVEQGDGSYTCSFTNELQRSPLCFLGSEQQEINPKAYRRAPTECTATGQGTAEDQELVFQAKAIASFTQDGPDKCLVGPMQVSWDDDSKYFFTSPWNAPCWEPKANDQGAPDPNTVPLETATFEWQNDEALQANQFAS